MILNGKPLLDAEPIKFMHQNKIREFGYSHGMSEAGYDIRIAETIVFYPGDPWWKVWGISETIHRFDENDELMEPNEHGRFCLASTIEEFQMPSNLTGIVHDKSTWARQGLSVFNTVIEPGWNGFLTLELSFSGDEPLIIPAGVGIAQVIFHEVTEAVIYNGKYQNAGAGPQEAIFT